jgi:alpha-amylase
LLVVVGDEKQVNPDANKWTKVLSGHHYAYYLANELETAWANRGSGDFYEPFDVTLTAVSNTPGVKLEYSVSSPEPSTRTMYSGGEVESGTTIKIDAKESVVLDVYLVIDGVISGGISRVFTYREPELEPEIVIPDFCTYAENEVCAFFEAPASWTKTIYCWAWTSNPAENFTSKSGTWPGVACEELGTAPNGNKVWKWKWDGTKQNNTSLTKPEMIIFSSEGAPQTADLVFENGGYYVKDGLFGVVESTTAIHGIETAHNGLVKVYSLDGRLLRTAKDSREATIGLPKGIYIVNNKKLVLK